jgi:hypothetical protein
VKPQAGPYDASRGVVIGYRNGRLGSFPTQISGIDAHGEIRSITKLENADSPDQLLITRYDDTILTLSIEGN